MFIFFSGFRFEFGKGAQDQEGKTSSISPVKDINSDIIQVVPDDSGVYVCSASSHVGSAFARAAIYVQQEPIIEMQPR